MDAKNAHACTPYFYEKSMRAAVCFFSRGKKGEEAVGKRKRERVKGLEGKPPAEERRALGPERMKERGFDNFLQSPSEKGKSIPEDTRKTAHSLYLEVSIRCQRSF